MLILGLIILLVVINLVLWQSGKKKGQKKAKQGSAKSVPPLARTHTPPRTEGTLDAKTVGEAAPKAAAVPTVPPTSGSAPAATTLHRQELKTDLQSQIQAQTFQRSGSLPRPEPMRSEDFFGEGFGTEGTLRFARLRPASPKPVSVAGACVHRANLKQMVIVKEILDRPVSRRPRSRAGEFVHHF